MDSRPYVLLFSEAMVKHLLLTLPLQVASAQATELKQSKSLKGTKDDMSTIAQLEKEFAGGIEQNKKNKAAVSTPIMDFKRNVLY